MSTVWYQTVPDVDLLALPYCVELEKVSASLKYRHRDAQLSVVGSPAEDRMFESTKETFRIRCCVIYFYLEDGTVMVRPTNLTTFFLRLHRLPLLRYD